VTTSGTAKNKESGARHALTWPLGIAIVLGGIVGALVVGLITRTSPNACDATKVASQVLPSVVTLSVSNGRVGSVGSGEVIDNDGHILTNNHVVSLAADGGSIHVIFSNGSAYAASITGRDPAVDLAVVKVNAPSLHPINWGNSSNLEVGQPVVALGAPLGLSSTVTSGIVSALDRSISVPADHGESALLVSAIQTDTAINPGNSGGALTDCSGDLVGIPSAGATIPDTGGQTSGGSIGLAFAIPADFAKPISEELISTGTVVHSYFGISVITLPPSAAADAGLTGGLYVTGVVRGGPSDQAGLREGDVITSIDGQPARDATQLEEITLTKKPGDTVDVTYERNGQSQSTTITLGTEPG
jgi:putative serine protease PepD